MSKIRLTPNASGTGTVTLTVPSTSTDRTITLTDTTGTLLDSSGQYADQWYLNTNWTTNADITAWTRLTSDNGGNIGSAMSVSSGVFTFRPLSGK